MSAISDVTNSALSNAFATGATASSTTGTASPGAATGPDALANADTFLQLLVAQLKNQDPSNPVQGTEFVTQLAQFSNLEQSVTMRNDLEALRNKYAPAAAPSASGN